MRICNTIHTQCSPIRYLPLPTWDLEPPWPRHRLHKVLQCHCRWPPRRPRTLHPATRPLRRRHAWRGAVPHFFWPIENWWVCHEQICFMASLPWANMFYGEFPWVNLFYGDFAMKNCDSAIVLKVVFFFFRSVFCYIYWCFFAMEKQGNQTTKNCSAICTWDNPPGTFKTPCIWLVVSTLWQISQLGWLFPIYGKIKNDPNNQPCIVRCCCRFFSHNILLIVRFHSGRFPTDCLNKRISNQVCSTNQNSQEQQDLNPATINVAMKYSERTITHRKKQFTMTPP